MEVLEQQQELRFTRRSRFIPSGRVTSGPVTWARRSSGGEKPRYQRYATIGII
jgi:hypothetical protein